MSEDSLAHAPCLDWEGRQLMARHADWWRRRGTLFVEVEAGTLGDLWLPLADGTLASEDLDLTPEMLDVDRVSGEVVEPGPLLCHGDAFATRAPYGRVPWVEAILGCPIRATIIGGSMRTRSFITDWGAWKRRDRGRGQAWFDLLKLLTERLVERSQGRYAVVHTLMRGPTDLAEAVLGPEFMSLSMYDSPTALRGFLEEVTQTFIEILQAQLERIPTIEGGYVHPYGVWAPGTVVRTQCDATAFLSARQYAEWFLPYDQRISAAVDYALIHLHSCSLHTVEPLLQVERPQAIQVTLETGDAAPTLQEMVPTFQRILAVRPLIVDGPLTPVEVHSLREELPADGLYIRARRAVDANRSTGS
jgi:hypothetical protein